MKSNILEYILDYINIKNTNYAIMIDGKWGTGKTFFIKNTVKEELKTLDKKVIYISLYGISKIEDIKENIVNNILISEETRKKLEDNSALKVGSFVYNEVMKRQKFIKDIDEIISNQVEKIKHSRLDKEKDNIVIIMDDLERSKIDICEVLGLINALVEEDKLKVIVISNQEEINNSNEYIKIKEKTISKTMSFKPNNEEVINELISSYDIQEESKDISEFVNKNIEVVLKTVDKIEDINFRSLRCAIDTYICIYHKIKDEVDLTHDKDIYLNILRFTIAYTLEVKSNPIKDNLFDEIDNSELYLQKLMEGRLPKNRKKESDKDNLSVYVCEFEEKYFNTNDSINHFYKFVQIYINHSIFDLDKAREEIKFAKSIIDKQNKKDYYKLMEGYYYLNDDTFNQVLTNTYKDIEAGDIHYKNYSTLYKIFMELDEIGLINESMSNYYQIFLTGLEKTLDKEYNYIHDVDLYKFIREKDDNNLKIINDKIIEINNNNGVRENKISAEKIWLLLNNNDFYKLMNLFRTSRLDFNILEYIDPKDLFDLIIKLDNSNLNKINYILYSIYNKSDSEKKVLIELKALIEVYISGEKRLSNYILSGIAIEIDKIINTYK